MSHTNLTVYGATWCSDCKRAKKFLGEQRVHYNWIDVEQDAAGLAFVEQANNGKRIIPTIVFDDKQYCWSNPATPSWRRNSACRRARA